LELKSEYSDVLYFTNVRWLSLGKMLQRVWKLKEEIVMFLRIKKVKMNFLDKMNSIDWVLGF
jgi:hypothetical protein